MNEAERKHIVRQYNYNRVPHPLVEGLVLVGFGAVSAEAAWEYVGSLVQKIEENEIAKIVDDN